MFAINACKNCGYNLRWPVTPVVGVKPVHDMDDPNNPSTPVCDNPESDPTAFHILDIS